MDYIAALSCVLHRPGGMIQFLQPGNLPRLNWPLRTLVPPTTLDINGGLSICVYNNLDAGFLEAFSQLGDK
jgi:hypothetical protein